VIGRNMQRHRHQEFIRFLNLIEARAPAGKAIHVILDNYAAHKHPKVREWLQRHPRFTFHFTPTSCSWLNAVEGFFARLTNRRLKRGVFHSLVDLQAAINRFLDEHNANPKPFIWTADPDKIIAADRPRAPSARFEPLAGSTHLQIRAVGHGRSGGKIAMAANEGKLLQSCSSCIPLIPERSRAEKPIVVPYGCPDPIFPSAIPMALATGVALAKAPSLAEADLRSALAHVRNAAIRGRSRFLQECQELAAMKPTPLSGPNE
jgi:transposase